MRARIQSSNSRTFVCMADGMDEFIQATSLAKLLKKDHIVVGDYVRLEKDGEDQWTIMEVEPRTSAIFRNIPREHTKKIIAANVDLVLIIVSADLPTYKRGLVDRYLVRASQWELPVALVFNKMDLFQENFDITFETERLKELGVKSFELSAENPQYKPRFLKLGLKDLKRALDGKTAILLGQSGVGKSRLITELSDGEADLLSGDIGKVGKGMHTTTWAELIECGGFDLVDSPGVRSMSLDDIRADELLSYFPDLADLTVKCKFSNCEHADGSKGCYFQSLKGETPETQQILSRLESYKRIRDEINVTPDWDRD